MHGGLDFLYPKLAELALHAAEQRAFRHAWLKELASVVGFDGAAIFSSLDGKSFATHVYNGDEQWLQRDLTIYLAEFNPSELSAAMKGRSVQDHEVFPVGRREQLRIYTEYCAAHCTVSSALKVWIRDGQLFFVSLSRSRGMRAFSADDLQRMDAVFPMLELGEALHARTPSTRSWEAALRNMGVSAAESTVVCLAQRGLTNPEIAAVVGTRPSTVRNQLSSAYRKLGVANRTALAFLLARAGDVPNLSAPINAVEALLTTGC
jgi:DNA-binding CsgD family transcriptional regulator